MKKIVLLNTTILTRDGAFELRTKTLEEVKGIIKDNQILSAIGHQSTADILSELLEIKIEVNRILYEQKPEDIVICFKLNGRPEEGEILSKEQLKQIGYTFKELKDITYYKSTYKI